MSSVRALEEDDEVAIARDIERRDGDAHSGEGRHQLPIAVDVAVPVEAAPEAGAGELAGVEVDVRFGEPGGQALGVNGRG